MTRGASGTTTLHRQHIHVPSKKSRRVWLRPEGSSLVEEAVYTMLIAGLVLSFSTALQFQFTLPKLLILRMCVPVLLLIWMLRLRRGETGQLPPFVLACSIALAGWWAITTMTAVDRQTALDGVHGRFNGLWTQALGLTLFVVAATSRAL